MIDNKLRKRKDISDDKSEEPSETQTDSSSSKKLSSPQNGTDRATLHSTHRIWMRVVMVCSIMTVVYFYTKGTKETKFALQKETLPLRMQKMPCSPKLLSEMEQFPKCVPSICGRFVTDSLIEPREYQSLLNLFKSILKFGGSSGGASILDLHSGAMSRGKQFVDVYKLEQLKEVLSEDFLVVYRMVKSKIKYAIAQQFAIEVESLYLTHPTFFSRITNESAKTIHDEYWHPHVDKDTYESFHYTSLLYLNDFEKDFRGGRFLFIDDQKGTISAIEPKAGRVSAFTSGAENLHKVEQVTEGTRFAITISFTCDPKFAISDPKFYNQL